MKVAITGRPGIGKTTACLKVYNKLKDKLSIEGFITFEVREKGKRIGFKIRDLRSGKETWLAKVGDGKIKVGKYAVYVDAIDNVSDEISSYKADLIIIDEIGPMEIKSNKFVKAVDRLIDERDNLLFSIHLKSKHPLIQKVRNFFNVFILNEKNRDIIPEKIAKAFEKIK